MIRTLKYAIIPALIFVVVSHGGTFDDVARACVWVVSYGIVVMALWPDKETAPGEEA